VSKKATRSIGTKLKIGLNFVADLSSIGSPSMTTEELDVTTLDSEGGFREFIAGFTDPGEVAISGYFVPSDVGQAELIAAMKSKEIQDFEIIYPPQLGASWRFQGYVSAFNVTAETEEAVSFEATIRVSGEPDLTLGESAGLTNLVINGSGGSLSPAFDPGTIFYSFDGVTSPTFTVTASAPNHELRLYVDGQFQEALTSGQPSSAIEFGPASSRKVTVVAHEKGKASVAYEVVVTAA